MQAPINLTFPAFDQNAPIDLTFPDFDPSKRFLRWNPDPEFVKDPLFLEALREEYTVTLDYDPVLTAILVRHKGVPMFIADASTLIVQQEFQFNYQRVRHHIIIPIEICNRHLTYEIIDQHGRIVPYKIIYQADQKSNYGGDCCSIICRSPKEWSETEQFISKDLECLSDAEDVRDQFTAFNRLMQSYVHLGTLFESCDDNIFLVKRILFSFGLSFKRHLYILHTWIAEVIRKSGSRCDIIKRMPERTTASLMAQNQWKIDAKFSSHIDWFSVAEEVGTHVEQLMNLYRDNILAAPILPGSQDDFIALLLDKRRKAMPITIPPGILTQETVPDDIIEPITDSFMEELVMFEERNPPGVEPRVLPQVANNTVDYGEIFNNVLSIEEYAEKHLGRKLCSRSKNIVKFNQRKITPKLRICADLKLPRYIRCPPNQEAVKRVLREKEKWSITQAVSLNAQKREIGEFMSQIKTTLAKSLETIQSKFNEIPSLVTVPNYVYNIEFGPQGFELGSLTTRDVEIQDVTAEDRINGRVSEIPSNDASNSIPLTTLGVAGSVVEVELTPVYEDDADDEASREV